MAKLKIPSIQHLARNWKPDSGMICRDLVRLVRSPPMFNYKPVFSATSDMLQFNQPLPEIIEGIKRKEKREVVRKNYLELVPLIHDHFQDVRPDFVNPVSTRLYPIGAGLSIPFTPPLIYGVGGKIRFPWFSFWRAYPLAGDNLRLFVTLANEILGDDPDLEDCEFEILDFSAPKGSEDRVLEVLKASDIEPLDIKAKSEMLEVFVDGYIKAKAVLEAEPTKAPREERRDEAGDRPGDQPDLFG